LPSDRLFGPSMTTQAMARATSDEAWLVAMLRFESALATAQGRLGLISPEVARRIAAACDPAEFDVALIGSHAVASASPVVSMVARLRELAGDAAGPYAHRDTTSQDVIDTAMMLVARDGLDLLLDDLSALGRACLALAERHRETPMTARTLMRAALPTTFGCKAGMWLQGLMESRRRLRTIRHDRLAVQLAGPVGTLDRPDLVAELARELDLRAPELPWHSARGRVVELGGAIAQAAGAAAKIAGDVLLLLQDEVGEVTLAQVGESSAMAHKRNAAAAVEARAAFKTACAQASVLSASAAGEHERSAGAWQAEWPALSELLRTTAGTVGRTLEVVEGLQPDPERMRDNLERYVPPPHDAHIRAAAAMAGRAIEMYTKELRDD
jgi:3-carboxy-cis,cis-muconate cycloisomerase